MTSSDQVLNPEERAFYCRTFAVLQRAGVEFLVGGAYAFARYTGIERHTKDLDIFVRATDFEPALQALNAAGYATSIPFPHWLGKAYCRDYFVDVIHGSGNGLASVDQAWFDRAHDDQVFDLPVRLCPVEEMIWSKAFIQERERFDGADVAHLLLAQAERLDWRWLLRRFGPNWRVLLAHLVLFGFVYPTRRDAVPAWVMHELIRRLGDTLSAPPPDEPVCRGTLLSRQQYLRDTQAGSFRDARLDEDNPMSEADIEVWTAAIANDGST